MFTVYFYSDPCSLECFSLKYDIDWPCNIVITESNEKKYSQVFGFLLKLKHVMWVLNDVRTRLSIAGDLWQFFCLDSFMML